MPLYNPFLKETHKKLVYLLLLYLVTGFGFVTQCCSVSLPGRTESSLFVSGLLLSLRCFFLISVNDYFKVSFNSPFHG